MADVFATAHLTNGGGTVFVCPCEAWQLEIPNALDCGWYPPWIIEPILWEHVAECETIQAVISRKLATSSGEEPP